MPKQLILFLFIFFISVSFASMTPASLDQKIGQMLMIGFEGEALKEDSPIANNIRRQQIGGVILYSFNFRNNSFDNNIKTPTQVKKLNYDLQALAGQVAQHNGLKPLLIAIDYEGGKLSRLNNKNGFPQTQSAEKLANAGLAEAKKEAFRMASTLKNLGFNVDFAPVVDLKLNPENPVIAKKERSFSEDPNTVIAHAAAFSESFKQNNITCTLKHFPGHGSTYTDTHDGFVDASDTWQAIELTPYIKLINSKTNCDFIMTTHVVNKQLDKSGLPATFSKRILTDLLRNKLKFEGLIITDDLQMRAITNHYTLQESIKLAINAGADILLLANTQKEIDPLIAQKAINIIKQLIAHQEIDVKRIDESYRRIMKIKAQLSKN